MSASKRRSRAWRARVVEPPDGFPRDFEQAGVEAVEVEEFDIEICRSGAGTLDQLLPQTELLPPRRQQHPNRRRHCSPVVAQLTQERQNSRSLAAADGREMQDIRHANLLPCRGDLLSRLLVEQVQDLLYGIGVEPRLGEIAVLKAIDQPAGVHDRHSRVPR